MPPNSQHDRRLLLAAASITLPILAAGLLITAHFVAGSQSGSALLTSATICAIAGATAIGFQMLRKVLSVIGKLRVEVMMLRQEVQTLRVSSAVADIAGIADDNVVPFRVNGTRNN